MGLNLSPAMEIKFAVSLADLKEKGCKTQKGTNVEKRGFLIPLKQNSAPCVVKTSMRHPTGFIAARNAIGNLSGKRTAKTIKYTIVIQNGGRII